MNLKPMIKPSHLKTFHRSTESQSISINKIFSSAQSQNHMAILPAAIKKKLILRNSKSNYK